MAFEIEWTKRADLEFDEITHFINNEWGTRVKYDFISRFYKRLELIRVFPEMGFSVS